MFNGRSHGNKIQKLRKFRANEYRVKFTWTMLSAAEILYQKFRLSYSLDFQKTLTRNAPKGAKKKLQESSR